MSKYTAIIPTVYGQAMIAESFAKKEPLIFTKIKLGDGTLSAGESSVNFKDLKNTLMECPVNELDNSTAGQVTLKATADNSTVETGFFAREFGVFAKVGESGSEQLFAYTNAGNYSDYMPDKTSTLDESIFAVTLPVGNASTVTAVINSQQYATVENLNNHNNSESAHANLLQVTTTADKPASMADRGLWVEIVG